MKLIIGFFRISYLINLTYRFGLLMRLIRDFLTPLAFIVLWSALFRGKESIGGFTFGAIVTYYILVKVIDQLYSYEPAKLLTREIRTGDLSNYLTKPFNYFKYLFGYTFGKRIARTTLTLISTILLFIFFPKIMSFPPDLIYGLLFLISLSISLVLVFLITSILGSLTFWISETDYFRGAIEQMTLILGGLWVPLSFFPKEITKILDFLPFKYQYFFPTIIFQGKISYFEAIRGLIIESFWTFLFIVVLKTAWTNGIKKYEGYGR